MRRKLPALIMLWLLLAAMFTLPAQAATPEDYDKENPQSLVAENLYSEAAIMIDADSGDVLFSKNDKVRMYPASTTKVMTLLLGIESGIGMDSEIAIPQAAADIPKDSSLVPVFPGENMTFGDLLKGFMINSGNDAGNAIAVLVSGTTDAFVDKMNSRAAEIGCENTHFANPHGYHNENHYTTAYDLALITREAMKNKDFRNIVSLETDTIQVKERGEIKLTTKNSLMQQNSKYYYKECIGVKTGYTSSAGYCFVGAAEKDGAMVITVTLNGAMDEYKWIDTTRMFNYGWNCYDTYTLDQMYQEAKSQIASVVISNAAEEDPFGGALDMNIAQISNTDYLRMVEKNSDSALSDAVYDFALRTNVEVTRELTAPISEGEIMGSFSYQDATTGELITAVLVASRDVEQKVVKTGITDLMPFLKIFENKVFLLLLAVLTALIILIIILGASQRAARQRRRRRIYEQRKREYLRSQQITSTRTSKSRPSGNANTAARRRDPRRPH